ncbi:MAG: sensor histidine kinase [Bacteroidales bacterium]|jgi:signal transduction histidine kinase|nr:sensor histidine kinase [Bacteroidales bacterium]
MRYRFCFLLFLFVSGSSQVQAAQIDSLEIQLQSATDTNKVKILCDLCWEYRFVSSDKALSYGNEALELANQLVFQKGIAQSYNDMGIIYIDKGNYSKAIDYFNESMQIRKVMNDSSGMASLFNKIGIVYQKKGQLKDALENQIKALKIYEAMGYDLWIGYCLNNIAIVHQNLGNLEKSLIYHEKALAYRIKMEDVYGEAGSYGNMANVYVKLHDTTKAVEYYNRALRIFRDIDNKESISAMLSNLGNIYIARGEEEKALRLLNESLDIREKSGDKKGLASSLIKIGEAYTNQGKYQEASEVLYRGLNLAKEIDVVEEEMVGYLNLAKMYALQHELDSAFRNMSLYISTKDSVYNQRLEQQIIDVQTRYETERMEQDIDLLKNKNELAELNLKQKRTENLILILLVIMIIGAAIFTYYRYKLKQKAALAEAIIRHNEQKLKAVLEGQEAERRRIARELHDGVGQKLAGLKLNWSGIASDDQIDKESEVFSSLSNLIDDTASEVRNISHQMLPKELEQFGLIAAIEGLIQTSFSKTGVKVSFEHFGIKARFSYPIELSIFRILQELITNILKHANATEVKIELLKRKNSIMLIVEDNGKGFDFIGKKDHGIGLMNIESRVESVNGAMNCESEINKGTVVSVNIPC